MPLALSSSLLRFVGVVGGHKCTVLIDGGSGGNFVSQDFVARHRIPTTETVDLLDVQLPSVAGMSQIMSIIVTASWPDTIRVRMDPPLSRTDVPLGKCPDRTDQAADQ
jgi:hypothetical protein